MISTEIRALYSVLLDYRARRDSDVISYLDDIIFRRDGLIVKCKKNLDFVQSNEARIIRTILTDLGAQ